MLFLITKKQKDKILDNYYSNIINLFTISIVILLIIFLILIFPTYLAIKVDKQILTDKLASIQTEMDNNKIGGDNKKSLSINDSISLLNLNPTNKNIVNVYDEIKGVYNSVPNVDILSINIDSLSKKIVVSANIDNKNTANILVDKLNNTAYKGAELPYSVFSQSKNFILNQNLSYE